MWSWSNSRYGMMAAQRPTCACVALMALGFGVDGHPMAFVVAALALAALVGIWVWWVRRGKALDAAAVVKDGRPDAVKRTLRTHRSSISSAPYYLMMCTWWVVSRPHDSFVVTLAVIFSCAAVAMTAWAVVALRRASRTP